MSDLSKTESRFYYPIRINKSGVEFPVVAPFVPDLGPVHDPLSGAAILSLDKGKTDQGLYVMDNNRWRYALPMVDVSNSVIRGMRILVFLDVEVAPDPDDYPAGAEFFKNGSAVEGPVAAGSEVWVVLSPRVVPGSGTVTSINHQAPDDDGNVTLDTGIMTFNGIEPDEDGNVTIDQFANFSISVPGQPAPDSLIFFQQISDKLELVSANATALELPAEEIVFDLQVNGVASGTFKFDSSGGSADLSFTSLSPGDILSISAPSDLSGASSFSFVLLLKRL